MYLISLIHISSPTKKKNNTHIYICHLLREISHCVTLLEKQIEKVGVTQKIWIFLGMLHYKKKGVIYEIWTSPLNVEGNQKWDGRWINNKGVSIFTMKLVRVVCRAHARLYWRENEVRGLVRYRKVRTKQRWM